MEYIGFAAAIIGGLIVAINCGMRLSASVQWGYDSILELVRPALTTTIGLSVAVAGIMNVPIF